METFKTKALQWALAFDVFAYLNSNDFSDQYSKFDTLLGVGIKQQLKCDTGNAFEQLETFRLANPGHLLGFFSYDLKNETEDLISSHPDHLQFPELYFFVPEHLILIKNGEIEIVSDNVDKVLNEIEEQVLITNTTQPGLNIRSRFNRDEYIEAVKTIQQHIIRGDIYETNFCQEFYADDCAISPLEVFTHLNKISPTPFAAHFKLGDKYIISASPERYLAKRGEQLISQPIKGTAKRSADKTEDERLKAELKNHPKEQQENVMIVDLVRNDLTRAAKPGTVQVEELFGIYSFEQVHQMISTVTCTKDEAITDVQAIKRTFPMGSMTGAPKVNAMRLMEQYERSKRGVYSGAIGYFGPDGDFDFNVVIRTILYNAENKYLSFQVGSAITHTADAEKEYEECLLKAKAIFEVLGNPL
ncbi:anthranilate synthase component I family protein [Mucilaginibacter rivuli]|uniref:anthranilate synthase component I family protein n=1 Tax=Mucilaginibacter rivuli TaxID=2857527 RepID=UPI0021078DD6|nr:anthranilate synthase component I family protein [Mucilaginibacter rivuli]